MLSDILLPVAGVSASWGLINFTFMTFSGSVNNVLKAESSAIHKQWAARMFENTVEQSPMFFTSLWLHALVVSPEDAAHLGNWYLGFMIMYPIMRFRAGGKLDEGAMLLSTIPRYAIVTYMLLSTLLTANYSTDLKGMCGESLILSCVGCFGLFLGVFTAVKTLNESLLSYFGGKPRSK